MDSAPVRVDRAIPYSFFTSPGWRGIVGTSATTLAESGLFAQKIEVFSAWKTLGEGDKGLPSLAWSWERSLTQRGEGVMLPDDQAKAVVRDQQRGSHDPQRAGR